MTVLFQLISKWLKCCAAVQGSNSLGQLRQLELQRAFTLLCRVDFLFELLLRTPEAVHLQRAALQVSRGQHALARLLLYLYPKALHLRKRGQARRDKMSTRPTKTKKNIQRRHASSSSLSFCFISCSIFCTDCLRSNSNIEHCFSTSTTLLSARIRAPFSSDIFSWTAAIGPAHRKHFG